MQYSIPIRTWWGVSTTTPHPNVTLLCLAQSRPRPRRGGGAELWTVGLKSARAVLLVRKAV